MTLSTCFRRTPRAIVAALIVLAAALGAAAVVVAQMTDDASDDAPQVRVEGKLIPARVRRGGSARADVAVKVAAGFHIQAHKPLDESYIATRLTWQKPRAGIRIGVPAFPQPVQRKFTFDERSLPMYEDAFVVRTRVTVGPSVPPGRYTLKGTLHYQACNDEACFAPRSAPVTIAVTVAR